MGAKKPPTNPTGGSVFFNILASIKMTKLLLLLKYFENFDC